MSSKPLAVDLFCGLGGWAEGFLSEGFDVIGFDIERHDYGTGGYPGQLVIQDVLTLHGSQFKDAAVIVASPPCQAYSYRAMPWNPLWLNNSRMDDDGAPPVNHRIPDPICNQLFRACFRIQSESSAAAGHSVPLLIENVRGAQRWVGRSAWSYGSFHLWGDVPALMPIAKAIKVSGLNWSGSDKPGYVARAFNTTAEQRIREDEPVKVPSTSGRRTDVGNGVRFTSRDCGIEGTKNGGDWFGSRENCSLQRRASSGSSARKAASAQIAKIPFPLAQHIARCYKPEAVA